MLVAVQVRDVSFSPDNGEVARLVYDEFGLATLPLQFFDCYSVSAAGEAIAEQVCLSDAHQEMLQDNTKPKCCSLGYL